jgi:hypothetical protein
MDVLVYGCLGDFTAMGGVGTDESNAEHDL